MVYVSKRSMLSGKMHSMEIPVDPRKLQDYNEGRKPGLIQNVFPELTPEQREFIMTGITPEEWESLMPKDG